MPKEILTLLTKEIAGQRGKKQGHPDGEMFIHDTPTPPLSI
jgi:hypothetical protein